MKKLMPLLALVILLSGCWGVRSGQPCGEQRHGRPAHASGYPDHPGQPHSFGGGEPTPAYARPHAGGGGARPHTRPTSDPDPGSNLHPRVRGG